MTRPRALILVKLPVALALGAWGGPNGLADSVARRGGLETLAGEILLVDSGGVEIRTDTGVRHLVPWDRVRQVTSESHATDLRNFRETAELVWRARSRVERHDLALAEPLLEKLFEDYRGQTNPTALVVAEGLLRCRLARGAQALAVIPALEVTRLRRAGLSHESTGTYGQLPGVMDDRYELCVALPPLWLATPALAKLRQDLSEYRSGDDAVTAAIASLYARSVARALGEELPPPTDSLPDHLGVELLAAIIDCGDPAPDAREQSRNWLARGLETFPAFAQAWARFHVGSSLVREAGLVRRQRGLVSLLHLPALHQHSQPYLAGIALSVAADVLEAQGDAEGARTLRGELAARYPHHPVLAAPAALPSLQSGDEAHSNRDPNGESHDHILATKEHP
jgi:hypothetical protein